jgi:hypothetical protein
MRRPPEPRAWIRGPYFDDPVPAAYLAVRVFMTDTPTSTFLEYSMLSS